MISNKFESVSLTDINPQDTAFKISNVAPSVELIGSIKRLGILNPPILRIKKSGFQIVSGFKRIDACRCLGNNLIYAHLLDEGTDDLHCAQIAISDNTTQRSLSLVEQAHAVSLLATFVSASDELLQIANCVGLGVNSDMINKLRALADMEISLKSGVSEGTISLPVALQLHEIKSEDDAGSRALSSLFRELGLSLSLQREMLEWIISICRWEKISISQLLNTRAIVSCRQDKQIDRRRKGQILRDYLKRRRYPAIVSHETRFKECLKRLKLSQGTHLIPPPYFESPVYCMKMEFKNPSELHNKIQQIKNLLDSNALTVLWDDPGGC